jgi:hypothetical protein
MPDLQRPTSFSTEVVVERRAITTPHGAAGLAAHAVPKRSGVAARRCATDLTTHAVLERAGRQRFGAHVADRYKCDHDDGSEEHECRSVESE